MRSGPVLSKPQPFQPTFSRLHRFLTIIISPATIIQKASRIPAKSADGFRRPADQQFDHGRQQKDVGGECGKKTGDA